MSRLSRLPIAGALCVICALLWPPAAGTHAQFTERFGNPTVETRITHPPSLGLQTSKVAFGPTTGDGAIEFIDALTELFVRSNVEVLERDHLQTLLKEHEFALTGQVDTQSAAAMGKIVGASIIILVNMQHRAVEKRPLYEDWRDRQGRIHRTYVSRTQAFVRGSVRAVDLATSRVFVPTVLDASPRAENSVDDVCCAEFPSEFKILDAATGELVAQAAKLFLPWTETVALVYYDDKDCDLKAAHQLHKAGDVQGALRLSQENLHRCKTSPKSSAKVLAHAYHNIGIGHFALGEYDKALEALGEAQHLRPAGIHAEAIAKCRQADELARKAQQVEETAALAVENRREVAAAEAAQHLTNKDVIEMTKAKLPDEIVVQKIKSGTCRFDTSVDALIQLKSAGVAESVVLAMLGCQKR